MKKLNKKYQDVHFGNDFLYIKSTTKSYGEEIIITCEENMKNRCGVVRAQICLNDKKLKQLHNAIGSYLEQLD